MAESRMIAGDAYVTKNGTYIYPNKEVDIDSLTSFILDNEYRSAGYRKNYDLYTGQHDILRKPFDLHSARPDNRLVSNWANYVVDTYVGYFMGKPPKISLENDTNNEKLQDWLNLNSFQDKLTEVAKQVAVYGKSYMLAYQDEQSNTKVAVIDPSSGFMIYDTSINQKPIAFVRYSSLNSKISGEVYTANSIQTFSEKAFDTKEPSLFKEVPAVEFNSNSERLSLVGKIKTLVDEYDQAFSQKANQVAYFDEAYLKVLGIQLPTDDDGKPIFNLGDNKILYSPDPNAVNGDVDFLSKPDGDTMQENMLNRLKDDIFQTAMVANLNDEAFSGNASGVAIKYKLLSMQNQAAVEERKFRISLRNLLGSVLGLGKVIGTADKEQVRKDLHFSFDRNIPLDLANEAQTAKQLTGVVSKETQLKTLDIVDDPKKEMQRIADEQAEQVKQAVKNQASAVDAVKGDSNDEETQQPQERTVLEEPGTSGTGLDKSKPSQ